MQGDDCMLRPVTTAHGIQILRDGRKIFVSPIGKQSAATTTRMSNYLSCTAYLRLWGKPARLPDPHGHRSLRSSFPRVPCRRERFVVRASFRGAAEIQRPWRQLGYKAAVGMGSRLAVTSPHMITSRVVLERRQPSGVAQFPRRYASTLELGSFPWDAFLPSPRGSVHSALGGELTSRSGHHLFISP